MKKLFSDTNNFVRSKDTVSFNMRPGPNGSTPIQLGAIEMLGDFMNGSPAKVQAAQKLLQALGVEKGGGDIASKDLMTQLYLRTHKGGIGMGESMGLGTVPGFSGQRQPPGGLLSSPAAVAAPAVTGRGLNTLAPQQNQPQ